MINGKILIQILDSLAVLEQATERLRMDANTAKNREIATNATSVVRAVRESLKEIDNG